VRTLLVPSTAVLLGRWNWWPARMGRRGQDTAAPPANEVGPLAAQDTTVQQTVAQDTAAQDTAAPANEPPAQPSLLPDPQN
jgi:uncharacterized membrane protein YdfJ with MMPL/SSD domain